MDGSASLPQVCRELPPTLVKKKKIPVVLSEASPHGSHLVCMYLYYIQRMVIRICLVGISFHVQKSSERHIFKCWFCHRISNHTFLQLDTRLWNPNTSIAVSCVWSPWQHIFLHVCCWSMGVFHLMFWMVNSCIHIVTICLGRGVKYIYLCEYPHKWFFWDSI